MNLRRELKYHISNLTAKSIAHSLEPYTYLDPYSKQEPTKSYEIHSLYFDTPKRDFFYEKQNGINKRIKIRIRSYKKAYTHGDSIFLEFKQRYGENFYKRRQKISFNTYEAIANNQIATISEDANLINDYIHLNSLQQIQPVVLVSFLREALFDNNNKQIRINFDRNLRARVSRKLFIKPKTYNILRNNVIFEIKCVDRIPEWLVNIIKQYNLEQCSFSKYCTSLLNCDTV